MFSQFLEQFRSNIEGLREFVDLIQPMLNEYHKKEEEKHDEAFMPLALAKQIHSEDDPEKKNELKEKLKEIFEGEIEVSTVNLDEVGDAETDEKENKKIAFKIKGDTSKIDGAFDFQVKSNEQKNLLYVNSLISLLSSAEWFYSQLLHFFYDKNPSAAGIKKKSLTLEELKSFGTVEDAEKYLIDSKIEGLLRSSFTDWIETLKSELKLSLGYMNEFIDELIEIYQRRNLFVHNGGIVNSIYVSKVDEKYLKDIEIGTKLNVDEEYLDNAINKIHVLFSLIACELWKKDNPADEERSDFLMDLNYGYLKRNKWEIAQLPNTFLRNDARQPTIPKTYAQLNCWLCEKRIGNSEKLQKELANVDFSDKSIVIQLALSALKEDKESFFSLLPRAINSEELPVEYLFDFPILQEMRDTENFEEFSKGNEKVQKYLTEKTEPNKM